MNKFDNCFKGFYWYSKSCHAINNPLPHDNIVDQLSVGFYSIEKDGLPTEGEFDITWEKLWSEIVPRLKAFDDSWAALAAMPELLEYMSSIDDTNIPIETFVDKLLELGFVNLTKQREE